MKDGQDNSATVATEYKLVPVDPMPEVIERMAIAHEHSSAHDLIGPMEDAYRALVAAAPTPPNEDELVKALEGSLAKLKSPIGTYTRFAYEVEEALANYRARKGEQG
jgi:hypothetical protein